MGGQLLSLVCLFPALSLVWMLVWTGLPADSAPGLKSSTCLDPSLPDLLCYPGEETPLLLCYHVELALRGQEFAAIIRGLTSAQNSQPLPVFRGILRPHLGSARKKQWERFAGAIGKVG